MTVKAGFVTTPVFHWNYESRARIKNNQGGTSSGKTYAILQVILLRLIEGTKIATIVGQDLPNLKKGALRDLQERVLKDAPFFQRFIKSYNKTSLTYTFTNGSILEFTSYKDAQDAKSGKRDILFLNEANGIAKSVYDQLAMRTTDEIFLDYNPSAPFWVHEHIINQPGAVTFYSNFTHNAFCPDSVKEYLLDLKNKDLEAWEVYGLGKTGTIQELIFKKFTVVPEMPAGLKYEGIGLDFGYTTDPTAAVKCGLANGNQIYVDEILYLYKAGPAGVFEAIKKEGVTNLPFYPDPAGILFKEELRRLGLSMRDVKKGPGSVVAGLSLLLEYELFFTERSYNLLNEVGKYKRKVDKVSGKVLNEPIDAFNHAIDALRYWAMSNLKTRKKRKGVRARPR